jgi:hypothetical protein
MMIKSDATHCPGCATTTTHVINTGGPFQVCICRICRMVFRATIGPNGRFTGDNVSVIITPPSPFEKR